MAAIHEYYPSSSRPRREMPHRAPGNLPDPANAGRRARHSGDSPPDGRKTRDVNSPRQNVSGQRTAFNFRSGPAMILVEWRQFIRQPVHPGSASRSGRTVETSRLRSKPMKINPCRKICWIAVLLVLVLPAVPAQSTPSPATGVPGGPERPEIVSLLGRPLFARPAAGEELAKLEREMQEAHTAWGNAPRDPEKIVMYGRRLGYLWRYHEAIAVFSQGAGLFPDHAPFYRHRGHRFISIRRFGLAVTDLEKAVRLAPEDFDCWYHLALACYLRQDFEAARRAWRRCLACARDDDSLIAVTNWLYVTCERLSAPEEARQLLTAIRPDMKVVENQAYFNLLQFYQGKVSLEQLQQSARRTPADFNTCGYGLARWLLARNRRPEGLAILQELCANPAYWPAFGFIAAETDLAAGEGVKDAGGTAAFPDEVQRTLQAWVFMWNTYDLKEVDRLFPEPPAPTYFSSEKEGVLRGLEALRAHHAGFGFVPGGKLQQNRLWLENQTVELFGDTAVVTATWFFQKSDGRIQRGPLTMVLARREGRTGIVHAHFANWGK